MTVLPVAVSLLLLPALRAQPAVAPVVYGQRTLAPLPGTGQSFKLHDWDGDGRVDLLGLVSNTYAETGPVLLLYRNVGTRSSPLFCDFREARVLLRHENLGGSFELLDVDGSGRIGLATIAGRTQALQLFYNRGGWEEPKWEATPVLDAQGAPFRPLPDAWQGSATLGAVDWDQDGRTDLLLGSNHPSRMLHAFGVSPETHQPEAGRVYFLRNTTPSGGQPRFDMPVMLEADGKAIACYGFAYPLGLDVNRDGLPDFVLGEHRPGTRVFLNHGTKGRPLLRYAGLFAPGGIPIRTSLLAHPEAAGLDGDGRADLVFTSFFGAPNLYSWFSRSTRGAPLTAWRDRGRLNFQAEPDTPLIGPGISTPEPVDWDGDGDLDLLLGSEPGAPMLARNIGPPGKKIFAPLERLRFVDGSFVETYSIELGDGSHHGAWEWYDDRSAPRAADWDGDGTLDLVSGTQGRRLYWLKGRNVKGDLRFERPRIYQLDGKPLLHPHRSMPAVADWDGDGKPDLVALNPRSEVVVYFGDGTSNLRGPRALELVSGGPVLTSLTVKNPSIDETRSGRSGIAVTDWDGDGLPDLVSHKHYFDGSVLLHLNAGGGRFRGPFKLAHLRSHLAGPSVADWNGDGYPDLLLGGDYGRVFGLLAGDPYPRAHYLVFDGRGLPVPPARRETDSGKLKRDSEQIR